MYNFILKVVTVGKVFGKLLLLSRDDGKLYGKQRESVMI